MPATEFTLVTFAVPQEAQLFRPFAANRSDVRVRVTGMGARHAEAAIREELKKGAPGRVLTCGFAGGLNPALKTGDLVAAWNEMWPDPGRLTDAGFARGEFLGVERIAVTAAEKQALRDRTGADAVEMESNTIQRVCSEHRVPAATLRVISDAADEDLPLDFNALSGPDWELSYARLALALVRAPSKVADLIRFQRRIHAAAMSLAAALRRIIETPP
jgi:nucleoside phosphorylase